MVWADSPGEEATTLAYPQFSHVTWSTAGEKD
jgi:hypothetical protein